MELQIDYQKLTLSEVISLGEVIGGEQEFIKQCQKAAGAVFILMKQQDPTYTMEQAMNLTIAELQGMFTKAPAASAKPKKNKAAKLRR